VDEALLLLPNQGVLDQFAPVASSWLDRIAANCFSNLTLANLRDALLPKLLSGELRIPDAEQQVEKAL